MKTFRDFLHAHPAADDCSGCGQPIEWPWLVSPAFLDGIREQVDDLEITEPQELASLASTNGELRDCKIIWDQFISWRRQQEKMQQLGISYGLINRPVVGK